MKHALGRRYRPAGARARALRAAASTAAEDRRRLHDVLMQAPALIAILRGPNHVFELANPPYLEMIGRDVVGKSAREALPELVGERGFSVLLDRVYSTGEPQSAVGVSAMLSTDEERIFDFVYQPLRGHDGRVNGIFIHGVDVTAQRHAERTLARLTRQAMLGAAVGNALASTDTLEHQLQRSAEAIVSYLGAALARIWVLEPGSEDLELRAAAGLYTNRDGVDGRLRLGAWKVGRIARDRKPVLTNNVADDEEIVNRARVVPEGIVAFAGYPLVADDHVVGVVAILAKQPLSQDAVAMLGTIADQLAVAIDRVNFERERDRALRDVQSANDRLQESERECRTLADAIPQLAWMTDQTGAVCWFNKQWHDYAGPTAERAKGWGWQEFTPPEEVARIVAGVQAAVKQGRPWEDYVPIRRADGVYRRFLCRARPVHNSRGEVTRWFGTATDVEDQRRSESALRERAEFEEQLIGIVSHDLRNPLQAVLLGAESLLRRDPAERTNDSLGRIRSSAQRALVMVGDLLDFTAARLRGGLSIERESVHLGRLVEQLVDETRLTYPDREIRLQCDGDLQGEWDPARIGQLVTNLTTNALKYSPKGTPVELQARGEGDAVVLVVHNAGPPIPRDMIGLLFEPMRRAAKERTDRSLGLGLYIVKNIASAHGAYIDVESTAETGTSFTVRLPRTAR